jgi:hypothetical protein
LYTLLDRYTIDVQYDFRLRTYGESPEKMRRFVPDIEDDATAISSISKRSDDVEASSAIHVVFEDDEITGKIEQIFEHQALELYQRVEQDLDIKVKEAVKLLSDFAQMDEKAM